MQIYANVPSGNMHSNMANILWIVYMWKLRFCTGNYSERTAGSLKPQTFMQHEPVQKWDPEKITVQWWTQQVQIFVWTVGRSKHQRFLKNEARRVNTPGLMWPFDPQRLSPPRDRKSHPTSEVCSSFGSWTSMTLANHTWSLELASVLVINAWYNGLW